MIDFLETIIADIEALGEMLTIALLTLALGIGLMLLLGAILDIIEGSRNKEISKNEIKHH